MTTIAGVPLFSTVQEALLWADANGLTGYHTHSHQSQVGYMGGANHLQATGLPINTNAPPPPSPPPPTPPSPQTIIARSSNGSSGGGGGY